MAKSRSAEEHRDMYVPSADAATGAYRRLGELWGRVAELQAEYSLTLVTESWMRYAHTLSILSQYPVQLRRVQRMNTRNMVAPLDAWTDAVTGIQGVMLSALMQASALLVVPGPPKAVEGGLDFGNRRVASVVIPFPERRRQPAG